MWLPMIAPPVSSASNQPPFDRLVDGAEDVAGEREGEQVRGVAPKAAGAPERCGAGAELGRSQPAGAQPSP